MLAEKISLIKVFLSPFLKCRENMKEIANKLIFNEVMYMLSPTVYNLLLIC